MDIVEQLQTLDRDEWGNALLDEAADEIERLRKELAAAQAETDSVTYARDRAYEQLAAMTKERDELKHDLERHIAAYSEAGVVK